MELVTDWPQFLKITLRFVNSNPYRAWYLAMNNQKAVGTFYLSKENTIGINISEINYEQTVAAIINYVKNNYSPLPEIKSVRASIFTINVPPTNLSLIKILEKLDKGNSSNLLCS